MNHNSTIKKEGMPNNQNFKPWGMELQQFCMLMHLSQLTAFIIPLAGLVLPIVMWQTNKDKSELINEHGKNIANWLISSLIYFISGAILTIIGIGLLIMLIVGVLNVIFAVKGAIKASKGELYKYPITFTFFR